MTNVLPARFTTPEMRTGLYYSAMFLPAGVSTLLLPIWLDAQGIPPEEIGVISATPIMIMILLNLFVGRIADRAKDWRSVIVAGSLVSAVVSLGFIFIDEFWGVLLFNTLVVIPIMAIEPVIDAAAIRMTRRRGSDFAKVRIWGTFGYIAITALAGLLFGWIGIAVFVPMMIATCLMRGAAALPLPFFRAPEGPVDVHAAAPVLSPEMATTMRQVLKPWFLLTLGGTALLQASHMLLISFGALLWVQAGVPEAALGILWIVAPICEIVTMLFFAHFAKRFSARHLLLAACLGGVLRWVGMAMGTDIWLLAGLQALHMLTFGLAYMGIINFIANWTSEDIAAQAQSFYVVLRQIASVIALIVFGPLVARYGLDSFYAAAVLAGLGAAMVFASLAIKEIKR
ncbi:MFS transporter [Pelagibacterium luteolum]|uniref:MFS transporter, PPP family, 3-phenylpropionic acid transporter n=1 Tax=Pelagibacterium luteolum TaxID=440168 RepID=A0A1G7UGN3_9HYPH|nr:MFS transporter [Pelagibacterium luteolum]SDG46229.1 MFS transporter, PPP family, 3-phenylpropionic acid transporter [Pelagibacterium luteolum]